MNANARFWWKVGYIVAIAVLIVPLNLLSQPATRQMKDGKLTGVSRGGKLAELREQYGLSEANLGEIDASAETVKLATLGLRGVAVQILWNKADYCKMVEDWSGFGAALTQIAYLQPHFYSVWDFQAHNLSYNTSVEFDDYHDRYYWVIEGIKFLKQGVAQNKNEPRLTARIGWFLGHKIGKADEHRQFRRLFKEDDDFHNQDDPNRSRSERDNWLVSKFYYKKAIEQVVEGAPLRTTAVIFYCNPVMSAINYSVALESDSTAGETPRFGDVARKAWSDASKELLGFAGRDIPSIQASSGVIHLNALEELETHERAIEKQLQELLPGEFDKLFTTQKPKLTPDQIIALQKKPEKRNPGEITTAILFWTDVAERTAEDRRAKARKLTADWLRTEEAARDIRVSRDIVNYAYWKTRCESEPTAAALLAREYQYKAGREQIEARPAKAKELFEQAFAQWRIVLDHFDVLHDDSLMAEDLNDEVEKYRNVLRQLDATFPEKFILQDMEDLYERNNPRGEAKAAAKGATPTTKPATKPEPKSETKTPGKSPTAEAPKSSKPSEPTKPAEKSAVPAK